MTRASADAPDHVTVYVTKEGEATNLCGDTHPRGVRYVKAPKADVGADGAALREIARLNAEVVRFRGDRDYCAKETDRLSREVDRLRARERRLVEAIAQMRIDEMGNNRDRFDAFTEVLRLMVPRVTKEDLVAMDKLRSALEEP